MASISIPGQSPWVKARRVVFRFLEDVQSQFSTDSELVDQLNASMALDGLHLDLIDPELSVRIAAALEVVAEATISGESAMHHGEGLDPESEQMYVDTVRELLEKLRASS